MTNDVPATELARAAAALGRPVRAAVAVAGSVANLDLWLTLDDAAAIMKIGPVDELRREVWACRRLAAAGWPVPGVLAAELDQDRPFLIMDVIPGAGSVEPSVVAAAGAAMRAVHAVELDGYGPLEVHANEARGRHGTWAGALAAETDGADELVAAGLLEDKVARAAVAVITGPLTRYTGTGRLLHRDLKKAHLFGVDDRLTGIIDWGDAAAGDPDFDVARLSLDGAEVTAAFCAGYGIEVPDPQRLAAYRIATRLAAMTYELRAGGDWFEVYREQLLADLRLLDPVRSERSGPTAGPPVGG